MIIKYIADTIRDDEQTNVFNTVIPQSTKAAKANGECEAERTIDDTDLEIVKIFYRRNYK